MDFHIRDFGAIADGKTLNTAAIQSAIDACAEAGGGRVIVSGGVYMTGTIVLKENVDLHMEADGTLLGSPDCSDYPEFPKKHVNIPMLPRMRGASLIYAEECANISITGMGKIDGNGTHFVEPIEAPKGARWDFQRIDAPTPPRVVFFAGCQNINIEDVTMVNQPSGWSYWIHDCDYVTFDRVKILADVRYPNNDGIHINSSRNVTVSDCLITCGDDAIVVRANNASLTENKVCEKVTVTNCNLTSYASGIRLGWINDGIIRNCTFSNIVMTNTTYGIQIGLPGRGKDRLPDEGREDTLIENIGFSNIIMDKIFTNPVRIFIAKNPVTRCAGIRNLYFNNVHATARYFNHLAGRENCRLQNIYFSNCSFEQISADKLDVLAETVPNNFCTGGVFFADNVIYNNTSFKSEV